MVTTLPPLRVMTRGMIEQLFPDGVLVEPADGAQPPGHGRAGPPECFQFPGERLDVGPADREQRQGPGAAPAGELAQVEDAGLAGQAAVAGQVPGEREPLGIGEHRLDRDKGSLEEVAVAAIGHLQGTARTWRTGPQVPATNDARNVCLAVTPSYATIRS